MEESRYLWVVFTMEGKHDDTDCQIDTVATEMLMLHCAEKNKVCSDPDL